MENFNQNHQSHCERCGFEISAERLSQETVICDHCGLTRSPFEQTLRKSSESRYTKVAIALAILIATSYVHLMEWDQDFFPVIPLEIKSILGVGSAGDHRDLVQICMRRHNFDCAVNSLRRISALEPQNSEVLFELGDLQRKTGDLKSALYSYETHFARGGQSADAAFELARLYERNNELSKAQELYQKALDLRPEVLQVTVIQNYVRLLVSAGQLPQAEAVIKAARQSKGPAGEAFMASEMEQIKKAKGHGA